MKKALFLVLLLTLVFSLAADKFIEDVFEQNNIMVSFKMESIGNIDGKIPFEINNGIVETHMPSFNSFATEYSVVKLHQETPKVKHMEWNDNGQYLQCIYKITIKDQSRIEQALNTLRKDSNINWADYVTINRTRYTPNDNLFDAQWYIPITQTDDVWDFLRDCPDILIGITDSGIKWNHPDLKENIWLNEEELQGVTINWNAGTFSGTNNSDDDNNGKVDDVMGWDFNANGGQDNNPMQDYAANTHGTHVAGCAGAEGDNGIGTAGPAFNAKLINCKGAVDNAPSNGISGGYNQIAYCADNGADVINSSWGGETYSLSYANNYINYATNYGSLVVVAAGNANTEHNAGYMDAPADCPAALCVAASEQSDRKASFSDFGAPIDIIAPGVAIRSTVIAGNGWGNLQGTSMASPIVAGIAGLVKQAHPNLTAPQLRERLMYTSDYIDDINPNYAGNLGSGRVNAYTAVLYDLIPDISVDNSLLEEFSGDNDGVVNPGDVATLKVRLTNKQDLTTGISWATATNTTATLRCNYPGVVIQDSVADYGTLTAGNFVWNDDSLFKFTSTSDITTSPIEFVLHIESNQGDSIPYVEDIVFEIALTLQHANWPVELAGQALSSPVVIDMDGDNSDDVVFGSLAGDVHVLNGLNEDIAGFPVAVGGQILLPLAVGDLNNDGAKDIVVVNSNREITAINNDGTILFGPINLTQLTKASPMIADLNNDGTNEVVVCTMNGVIHVFDVEGNEHTNYPAAFDGNFVFHTAIADLDLDGTKEIILQAINGNVLAVNYTTAQNIAGFPFALGGNSESAPIVANLDSDEYPELLVGATTNGRVVGLNHDGTVLFDHSVGSSLKKSILFEDINNDNVKELILPTYSGEIFAINTDGESLPNFPIEVGAAIESDLLIVNVDGDENKCIVVGDAVGNLHAYKADGSEAANFPIYLENNLKVTGAFGDVDGDGDLDFAIANNTGMQLIDLKRSGDTSWLMYRGNPGRTGNMFEAYTDNADHDVSAPVASFLTNYPNPFNPETTIEFSITKRANVSLDIYNIKGQKVTSLVHDNLAAGNHKVVWDGKDSRSNNVSSGVYFLKMKNGKYSKSRKIILMK